MAKAKHVSETPATQFLKKNKIPHVGHAYEYVDHGGTAESARQLKVEEHAVIKTLIMEDEQAKPHIVLMHGDREVSLKNLARQIGTKKMQPCRPEVASRHSGYQVGGTSPFGTRKQMPVWVEASILELPLIYINGGKRGYLVEIDPQVLVSALGAVAVNVGNE